MNLYSILKIAFSICGLITITSCELFTAVVDLEKLLYTEAEIIKTIDKYIEIEEKRLIEIRKYGFITVIFL